MTLDHRSVAGKSLDVTEDVALLVVGAGAAGIAAALEGAALGLSVMLVDEHPVAFETMAESVPLHFGGRMQDVVRNRSAMTEAMMEAAPGLAEAFEAGVDVRLGVACVGIYANGPNLGWMPGRVAMLVDGDAPATLVRFEQAVAATGRRDVGLAFEGWELPGVVGATAAVALATRYRALEGRRAVVLGSAAEALLDALSLAETGVEIVRIVEQAAAPVGPAALLDRLAAVGAGVSCGAVMRAVERGGTDGVRAATLSTGERIDCDLVVLGVGAVPVVDLMDAAGCRIVFDADRGGFAPALGAGQATSMPFLRAAGDCAGVWAAKSADPAVARAEGRLAAAAAAAALRGEVVDAASGAAPRAGFDLGAYRAAWVRASVLEAPTEPFVCQCEEVTAREILELRPPRYLGWERDGDRPRDLKALSGDGPPNPDLIKRLTRAGMGPCQGRRCREQVQALLALATDTPLADAPLARCRAPVRPVRLDQMAPPPGCEDPAFRACWDSWFGMPRQWVHFEDVEADYTAAGAQGAGRHVSE